MKTRTILAVLLLAASTTFAQSSYQQEAKALWDAREKAQAEAKKSLDAKYRDALEPIYWRAVQAKDAPAADAIRRELETVGGLKQTGPAPAVKPAALPKAMLGKWDASYPGGSKGLWEFKEDGTVNVTMGTGKIPSSAGTWVKTKDAVEATFSGGVTKFAWPIKSGKLAGVDSNGRSVSLAEARK